MIELIIIILVVICLLIFFTRPAEYFGSLGKQYVRGFNPKRLSKNFNKGNGEKYDQRGYFDGPDRGYWFENNWYKYYPEWYYTLPYYIANSTYVGPLYTCFQCGDKDEQSCGQCANCGWCTTNGVSRCVQGSTSGPISVRGCDNWNFSKS
ncbi:MAG: hypothetical protein Terrestrivirus5_109 [Terrestrivirus sp.]|uniref:Uncharacterized protein n=1 Tax=Terrestrivirus sp. TaxID=2487775 RepID=A0A3G4ZN40_9VIRU|nr:MAG: hypothetical protein Terrestrivirus5_109 [Terrestrivirus sp.]